MPEPTQNPSFGPDESSFDSFESESLRAHDPEAFVTELLPVFDAYCQEQGQERVLTADDIAYEEAFRDAILKLLGRPDRVSGIFGARPVATRGIVDWRGAEALVLFQELSVSASGHSVVPLEILRPDDAGLALPQFWTGSPEESFAAPVGILGKIFPGHSLTEIEPMLSAQAQGEAWDHARFLSRGVSRILLKGERPYVSHVASGSVLVALMLNAIQVSHERGDPDIPVHVLEGGSRPVPGRPELAPLLGLSRLHIEQAPNRHEIGVVSIDARALTSAPPEALEVSPHSLPFVEKIYSIGFDSNGHFLPEVKILDLRVSPYRRSA